MSFFSSWGSAHLGEKEQTIARPAPPIGCEKPLPRGCGSPAGMASWNPGVNGSRSGGRPPRWRLQETGENRPNSRAFTPGALLAVSVQISN